MAGKRGQSFFKPPKETLDLFADFVESEEELPPKSPIPAAASTKQHRPCLTLSSDDESPVSSSTVGFSNGDSQTSDRSAHRFSPYKPAKRDEQTRSLPRGPSRNPITPLSRFQPSSRPVWTPQPAPRAPSTSRPVGPVPSYSYLHAPQTARKDANIVARSDTGGKTVTKQHVRDLTPKRPKKGGKTVHPALSVPLKEEIGEYDDCEDGDEDEDRDSDSGDNDDDAEVPYVNNTNEASSSSNPPKEGTEHTFWRYHVIQHNDTRPQGNPDRKVLGTYIDKNRAIRRMLRRIQRLQRQTGGDEFEITSIFGPEGLRGQVVDSAGYGAVEVSIEKELVEGAVASERADPTNTWLPRSLYLVIVETRDLETGAVRTDVHEKVFTTLALANRHAAEVWRIAQLEGDEIQQRNLRNGTVINAPEGWAMKMLDELEVEGRLFFERLQLPLGQGVKKEEVTIKVCKHGVAGPRN